MNRHKFTKLNNYNGFEFW
uniref:Uncharacterized protein n=1 Tax=Lepeophtheirus salmonis TaxID=72036 RepID=A0A0K2TLI6_LEPSM